MVEGERQSFDHLRAYRKILANADGLCPLWAPLVTKRMWTLIRENTVGRNTQLTAYIDTA